jgi:hypothetical protein
MALNKIIIIDGQTVITGPFDFTKSAPERLDLQI